MDWNECRKKDLVKEIRTDKHLIASLLKSSSKKLESSKMLPTNDTTAIAKLSLAYDSLRELLEALGISKGYKVYNHDCYCAFLNEIMHESLMSREFDNFRKIRNKINYYGQDVSAKEAEPLLENIERLISCIKKKFFQEPYSRPSVTA